MTLGNNSFPHVGRYFRKGSSSVRKMTRLKIYLFAIHPPDIFRILQSHKSELLYLSSSPVNPLRVHLFSWHPLIKTSKPERLVLGILTDQGLYWVKLCDNTQEGKMTLYASLMVVMLEANPHCLHCRADSQ